jgi:hypothetical protein
LCSKKENCIGIFDKKYKKTFYNKNVKSVLTMYKVGGNINKLTARNKNKADSKCDLVAIQTLFLIKKIKKVVDKSVHK